MKKTIKTPIIKPLTRKEALIRAAYSLELYARYFSKKKDSHSMASAIRELKNFCLQEFRPVAISERVVPCTWKEGTRSYSVTDYHYTYNGTSVTTTFSLHGDHGIPFTAQPDAEGLALHSTKPLLPLPFCMYIAVESFHIETVDWAYLDEHEKSFTLEELAHITRISEGRLLDEVIYDRIPSFIYEQSVRVPYSLLYKNTSTDTPSFNHKTEV